MCDQEVESCDCVDEKTECSDARIQGEERIQQVLSVVGNSCSLQSASSQILAKVVERYSCSAQFLPIHGSVSAQVYLKYLVASSVDMISEITEIRQYNKMIFPKRNADGHCYSQRFRTPGNNYRNVAGYLCHR